MHDSVAPQATQLTHLWLFRFITYLRSGRHLSVHSQVAYQRDLRDFLHWCKQQGIDDLKQIDCAQVRAFAAHDHRRGLQSRSIRRRLSSLRNFFYFLILEGEIKLNPAVGVTPPKAPKHLPVTLDADQMARLLTFRADTELDKRDKAIMELFYSSGLRLSELVNLNLQDIDLVDQSLRVENGKGNKSRIVPIGRFAIDALQEWLTERHHITLQDPQALFVTRQGKRPTPRTIQLRVAEWAVKQGLPQHLHPHMFRHSFASHILESSQDLRGVQELLGHANLNTTQVYTHLDFQHLARIYDAAHPRAKRKSESESES